MSSKPAIRHPAKQTKKCCHPNGCFLQGEEGLRDVFSGASELHRAGCRLRETFVATAGLLPRLVAAVARLDLPSEAQLKELVGGGHTQDLVAAGATIIDAAADIYQSTSNQVANPPPPSGCLLCRRGALLADGCKFPKVQKFIILALGFDRVLLVCSQRRNLTSTLQQICE